MNTVFFGASEYVIPVLELLKEKFGLSLVVTTEIEGPVVRFAKDQDIPYLSVSQLNQSAKQKIQDIQAEVGIVADFGIIIPIEVIESFPKGILNIHPSLLPKYRGPTPVQTTLLNGDKETGVTIIKIDPIVDHGPILSQEEYEIENENAKELLTNLFKVGTHLLDKTLIDYLEEVFEPQEQEHGLATFTKMLSKKDGLVDPKNPPKNLGNMIRAYFPWPGVWTRAAINGKQVMIKLLPGNMVQVEGKNPQSYKDFANGYEEGKEILKKLSLTGA